MPLVAVILPTFNRRASLSLAIESVLAQTFVDFELIVVDDGSTDNSIDVIAAFSDSRMKVLRQVNNLGVCAARNMGMRHATAEYVTFHDSDDIWLVHKLARTLQYLLAQDRVDGVLCASVRWNPETGNLLYMPLHSAFIRENALWPAILADPFWFSSCSILVRRTCLQAIGGFDERLRSLDDLDICIRLFQKYSFRFLNEPLYMQPLSPDSLSRNTESIIASSIYILDKCKDAFNAHHDLKARFSKHLSRLCYDVGRDLLGRGQVAASRKYMRRVVTLQPWSLRGYVLWMIALVGGRGYHNLRRAMAIFRRPRRVV